jgi:hypothetical protein
MKKGNMTLKQALETMLGLAKAKLAIAKEKNSEWDIDHYEKDILLINEQLVGL